MDNVEQEVNFSIGELVRITENTDQEGIPLTRLGVITDVDWNSRGNRTGLYRVLFASGKGQVEMTLWHKFLEKIAS